MQHAGKHGIKESKGPNDKKEKKARKERGLSARPSKPVSSSSDDDDKRLLENCNRGNTTPGASSAAVAVPLPIDSTGSFPVSAEFLLHQQARWTEARRQREGIQAQRLEAGLIMMA